MTVQELYKWAKENNKLDYNIVFAYPDPETLDTIEADLYLDNNLFIMDTTKELIFS